MKNRNKPTVLITGTSSGIGQTLAKYLHENGYKVIGTSRNPDPNAEIRQLKLDVTNDILIEECVSILKAENITTILRGEIVLS